MSKRKLSSDSDVPAGSRQATELGDAPVPVQVLVEDRKKLGAMLRPELKEQCRLRNWKVGGTRTALLVRLGVDPAWRTPDAESDAVMDIDDAPTHAGLEPRQEHAGAAPFSAMGSFDWRVARLE